MSLQTRNDSETTITGHGYVPASMLSVSFDKLGRTPRSTREM